MVARNADGEPGLEQLKENTVTHYGCSSHEPRGCLQLHSTLADSVLPLRALADTDALTHNIHPLVYMERQKREIQIPEHRQPSQV